LKEDGFKVLSAEYVMAPMDVLPKGKFKDFVVNCFQDDTISLTTKIS
jgi:hypothetical protein